MRKLNQPPKGELREISIVLNRADNAYNVHICRTDCPTRYYCRVKDDYWRISQWEADDIAELIIETSRYFGLFLRQKTTEERLMEMGEISPIPPSSQLPNLCDMCKDSADCPIKPATMTVAECHLCNPKEECILNHNRHESTIQ